jgi:hypothetical protein
VVGDGLDFAAAAPVVEQLTRDAQEPRSVAGGYLGIEVHGLLLFLGRAKHVCSVKPIYIEWSTYALLAPSGGDHSRAGKLPLAVLAEHQLGIGALEILDNVRWSVAVDKFVTDIHHATTGIGT